MYVIWDQVISLWLMSCNLSLSDVCTCISTSSYNVHSLAMAGMFTRLKGGASQALPRSVEPAPTKEDILSSLEQFGEHSVRSSKGTVHFLFANNSGFVCQCVCQKTVTFSKHAVQQVQKIEMRPWPWGFFFIWVSWVTVSRICWALWQASQSVCVAHTACLTSGMKVACSCHIENKVKKATGNC